MNEEKSSKELVSSCLENWDGEFQDLLDIFSRGCPLEKKSQNQQDLEEELSQILKKEYVKPEIIFF